MLADIGMLAIKVSIDALQALLRSVPTQWCTPRDGRIEMKEPITDPRSKHVSEQKRSTMNVDQHTTVARRRDLVHPYWDGGQDHESASTAEETEAATSNQYTLIGQDHSLDTHTMNIDRLTLPANRAPLINVINADTPMADRRPHLSANHDTVKTPRKPPTW